MTPTDPPPPLTAPEAIERRRTVRRFDPGRPLADALLVRILQLATRAPSGFNLQPWRFLVVRRASNRRRLRRCAWNQSRITQAPVVVVVLGYHHPDRTHLGPMLRDLLGRGVVTPEEAEEWRERASAAMGRTPDRGGWASRTAMLAAGTLMTAAESLGVASALIEEFAPERLKEAFGVPDDHTVCGLVALGYAAEPGPFPGRFGLVEVCSEEHFGQPWTLGDVDGLEP